MADRYFLLGEHVDGSPTPRMMNAAFRAIGVDASYQSRNIAPDDFSTVFRGLKQDRARGFNITMPYKSSAIPLLESMDEVSGRVGAVNTVNLEPRGYRGYNTDVDGILAAVATKRITRLKHAVAFGTGGAARAFCAAMDRLGCDSLTFLSRNPDKTRALLSDLTMTFPRMLLNVASYAEGRTPAPDLIFNASPAGSDGKHLPPEASSLLDSRPIVFDAVYSPVETELLRLASAKGCPKIYGYEMLLGQAVKAVEIWTGRPAPLSSMKDALLTSLGAEVS